QSQDRGSGHATHSCNSMARMRSRPWVVLVPASVIRRRIGAVEPWESRKMKMTADVIIVGGAVMGSSVAWWLTKMQPGLDVLVLERDTSYSQASTALSVASIRQQFTTAVNVRISRFGVDFIRNFNERLGGLGQVASLGLKENGYLFLSSTAEGAAALADVAAIQRSEGAATELWSPDQ